MARRQCDRAIDRIVGAGGGGRGRAGAGGWRAALSWQDEGRYGNYAYDTSDRVAVVIGMTNGSDRPDSRRGKGRLASRGLPRDARSPEGKQRWHLQTDVIE